MAAPHYMDTGVTLRQTTPEAVRAAFEPIANLSNADHQSLEAVVRINTLLQTTLDIRALIQLFADELHQLVSFDGFRYRCHAQELEINIGKPARNSCAYRLIVREDLLGELKLSRRRKFTVHETQAIEHLLCALIYPLRNALTYLNALRAAHTDPLTGTNNRGALDATLAREVEMARRHHTPLSLIIMDIDRFKSVNDTYGHSAGDDIIKTFAEVVGNVIRKTDMLFRYGGEEFVVLLSNTTRTGAMLLAERIRSGIEQTLVRTSRNNVSITVSLGVSSLAPGDTHQSLFEKADQGLYEAKHSGRNCVRYFTQSPVEIL